jgi:hypothetical protein
MSILDDFRRVSRREPCPVCGRSDWCLVERGTPSPCDEPRVLCQRVESGVRWRDAGWLHGKTRARDHHETRGVPRLDRGFERQAVRSTGRQTARFAAEDGGQTVAPLVSGNDAPPDLSALLLRFHRAVDPPALTDLSHALGVSEHALRRMEIGRASGRGAWAFPMRDAAGSLRGIRLRTDHGRKLAIRGSHQGLFIPLASPPASAHARADERDEPLFIAEGPTDTAALLDLPGGGVDAIGRPSCNGCAGLCAEFVHAHRRWRPVVIVADNDQPGIRGAAALADELHARGVRARAVTPPKGVKDAREWKRRGLTREELMTGDRPVCRENEQGPPGRSDPCA